MSIGRAFPQVLGTYTPDPRPPSKRQARGYTIGPRWPTGKTLLTDHEVIEARWLSECGGWTHNMVRDRYGLTAQYTRRLLDYSTRSKLHVNEDAFPRGYAPPARDVESKS